MSKNISYLFYFLIIIIGGVFIYLYFSSDKKVVNIEKIELNTNEISVYIKEKNHIVATVKPEDATNKRLIWESSNTSVATVDNNGVVSGVSEGEADITVSNSDNTIKESCHVVVKIRDVYEVQLAFYETTMIVGDKKVLYGVVEPGSATYQKLIYQSSDSSIVTVDNYGNLEAKKSGTAIITVKDERGMAEAKCNVTVTVPLESIKLNKEALTLKIGEKETLTTTLTPSNASNVTLTWSSSRDNIATVDNNGLITAIGSGTTNIIVRSNNGKVATCKVTVVNPVTPTPKPTATPKATATPKPATSGVSRIHFMNTGSSDAIIIESNGKFGLVDSSNPYNDGTNYSVSSTTESVIHVRDYLKKLGVSKLNFVVGTHSHSDHIGGMQVIAENFVDSNTIYYYKAYQGTSEDSTTDWDNNGYYNRATSAMKNHGAKMKEITGQEPTLLFGDFNIKLMNTDNDGNSHSGENQNSIVQYITYKGKYKTLLASDMEFYDEGKIASKIGHVDILKVGHHSYASATSFDFANALSPKTAIITNNTVITRFIPVGYHMQEGLGTNFYLTGNTDDAVIVKYSDSGYTVSGGGYNFGVTSTSGEWLKINNTEWVLFSNGKVLHDDWYQDSDGKWYYLDSMGVYIHGRCATISGEEFCFNSSGACYKGRGC